MMNRIKRYYDYKEKIKADFLASVSQLNSKDIYPIEKWEEDFDYLNKKDIEDNSDYDSDNDVDPADTIVELNQVTQNVSNLSKSEKTKKLTRINAMKNIKKPIKVAIVGQRNVGKSSIINTLLKENRVIVSDVPGTTRDSIPVQWVYKGKRIILIDTAGLQAKNKVHDKIDKMVSSSTIKAIRFCHVVIYVIDSMEAFSPMDMKLIQFIGEEGRGIVVVANKWDLVENGYKTKAKKWMEDQFDNGCSEYKNIRINFVSAKNFFKVDDIMENVINSYNSWNTRINTNVLNEWVNELKKITNLPNKGPSALRLKFMTQIKTRPPSFTLFVNDIHMFYKSHEAFLKSKMSKEFSLRCSPIRFLIRDHKKINELNSYKKVSVSTAKIQKKLDLMKKKMSNPTYRRKVKGYETLHGKQSVFYTRNKHKNNK